MSEIWGFWEAARYRPDRIALIAPDGGEWAAGELLNRSNQLVHALRDRGMVAGDGIATIGPNHVAWFVALLAAFQAGWRYTPINSHLASEEMAYILGDSTPKAVLVHPVGFLCDHLEVLYDLDHEAAEVCDEQGIRMLRVPTPGCHPEMITMVKELIEERTQGTEPAAIGELPPWPTGCPPGCCNYP